MLIGQSAPRGFAEQAERRQFETVMLIKQRTLCLARGARTGGWTFGWRRHPRRADWRQWREGRQRLVVVLFDRVIVVDVRFRFDGIDAALQG